MPAKKKAVLPSESEIPQDLDMERRVLGRMIVAPATDIPAARAILRAEDFFSLTHGLIFAALLELYDAAGAESIDAGSLAAALRQKGMLDELGGPAYIGTLIDAA